LYGLPDNYLVFKIDIIVEFPQNIHAQQTVMGDGCPFVVDNQNVGAF
jgi:hypothetical protein